MQRGLDLDPHNLFFRSQLGMQLASVDRHDEAEALLLALPTGLPFKHEYLWGIYYHQARYSDALAHAKAFLDRYPQVTSALSGYEAIADRATFGCAMIDAADALIEHSTLTHVAPMMLVRLYTYAEQFDRAISWLGKAIDARNTYVIYTPMQPGFNRLWQEAGYLQAMRTIGLEQPL